jgi:hypothetical protein
MFNFLKLIDINRLGSRLKEKLVVIESDDWGSMRMPSREAYEHLLSKGIAVDKSPYTRYDGLERSDDVQVLLELLNTHKGSDGKSAILTANTVMGNPDFEAIESSDFQEYKWMNLETSYQNAGDSEQVLSLMQEGIQQGLWLPQFHGREHVNVERWLKALQNKTEPFWSGFEQGVWGFSNDLVSGPSIQASYDSDNSANNLEIIKEGLLEFYRVFKFNSETFIANNYIWSEDLNAGLFAAGVRHFQGMKYQWLPRKVSQEKRERIRRKTGQRNALGQTYAVRNCHFEPTEKGHTVEGVLKEVASAFYWKKPAIICTHRINYTSRLDVKKRDENIRDLHRLLGQICMKWPDVRFISSKELADVLKNDADGAV